MLTTMVLAAARDPNLDVIGVFVVPLITGVFMGLAVERKRDAFVSAFVAGLAGLWMGCLLFIPGFHVLTEAVSSGGLLLATLIGFALGFGFGLPAGAGCGVAAVLASGLSKSRTKGTQQGDPDASS